MTLKNYISPLTKAIVFAPEEHIMESIIIQGSGNGASVGTAPIR